MTHMFRKGDLVSVTGEVSFDQGPKDSIVFITLDGGGDINPLIDNVTLVAGRVDIGERVRWRNGCEGQVIGVDVDMLWVKLDSGSSQMNRRARTRGIAPGASLASMMRKGVRHALVG